MAAETREAVPSKRGAVGRRWVAGRRDGSSGVCLLAAAQTEATALKEQAAEVAARFNQRLL